METTKAKYFLDTVAKEVMWLDFDEKDIESMFDYSDNNGEFHHALPIVNFYKIVKDKTGAEGKVTLDAKKIKLNKDFWTKLSQRMMKEAEEAGYPAAPDDENPYSKNQPALIWMSSGPSTDSDMPEGKVRIEKGAFILETT